MRWAGLLLALALLPAALLAAAGDSPLTSLRAAADSCAPTLGRDLTADASPGCRELLSLLDRTGWDHLLGDAGLTQAAVVDLSDHLAFLARNADRPTADPGLLPALQARLAALEDPPARDWLERLRDWIRARLGGGEESGFSLAQWFREMLDRLGWQWAPSDDSQRLLVDAAMLLLVLLALGLVAAETWRWWRGRPRTGGPRGRSTAVLDPLPPDTPELTALRAAPLVEQPGLLYALLVNSLHHCGLLPEPRALTWREALERADPAVDRSLLAASGECAEQATFGRQPPATGDFADLLDRCLAQMRRLAGPGVDR